nr:reverse transcriptase domain-containing protein [Tanacetum cinerariifolium]
TSDPIISSSSPSFTPFEGSDFILEEIKTFLRTSDELSNLDDYYDTEGDILYLEKLLNKDPSLNLPPVKTRDLKQVDATMTKPLIEEPLELELKELSSYLEYSFLEGTDKLPVIISKELKDEEKSAILKVLKSHKRAIAWKISDIKGTFQRCMMAIFYDMIEKTMEVFMDDFSVFGDSFSSCLYHLDKMIQRCKDTNLVLNWKKCHFMVKEGIVLGHKISQSGIKVDKAKVDVIAKLPHPNSIKDSEESGVTYTDILSPFEELSDIGSPGADDHEYLMMIEDPYVEVALQAPPSLDYMPGPEEPEQAPLSPDYIPGLEHADDEIVAGDQPYVEDASPIAQSPEYVPESDFEMHLEDDDDEDPEEDPVDYPADGDDGDDEEESSEDEEDDEMDVEADENEEEEHLAPADSIVVAPTAADQAPSAEETEPFETNESAATP